MRLRQRSGKLSIDRKTREHHKSLGNNNDLAKAITTIVREEVQRCMAMYNVNLKVLKPLQTDVTKELNADISELEKNLTPNQGNLRMLAGNI